MTTHLLSKAVSIQGIVHTKKNNFYKFNFLLNRNGNTIDELVSNIDSTWKEFYNSAVLINTNFDKSKYNTSFSYNLESPEQKKIALIGIEEFKKLIPYVLIFIPKIDSIQIIDNTKSSNTTFINNHKIIDKFIIPIVKKENDIKSIIHILKYSGENTTIACEVKKKENNYHFVNIDNIPKIFCDFPLIGTEKFHLPIIVNSFHFNPQTERDGIWLKGVDDEEVIENQKLLTEAINLYKELLPQISDINFLDFYNIIETRMPHTSEKYFDALWYKESIQNVLRKFIQTQNIVEVP